MPGVVWRYYVVSFRIDECRISTYYPGRSIFISGGGTILILPGNPKYNKNWDFVFKNFEFPSLYQGVLSPPHPLIV